MPVLQPGIPFTVLVFIGVIGSLVFVHEFGHYYVARLCGVRADTFSIGFGMSGSSAMMLASPG